MKPLAIDLFCGLGGWTDGLLAEGYCVVGFDVERHEYAEHRYPAQLVLQDVHTIHGRQFKNASLIVASPPRQEFSYMAMPWRRAKQIQHALIVRQATIEGEDFPPGYTGSRSVAELTALFDACFRIQREACEAAGRHIPLVVENVKGAQRWVGRSRWNYGSYHLWGDVPALMPIVTKREATKAPGNDWNRFRETGEVSPHWNLTGIKNAGGSWFRIAHNTHSGHEQNPDGRRYTPHMTNPLEHDGVKHHASGAAWFDTGPAALPPGSPRRKAASALIAKIPFSLARHIARCWHPRNAEAVA